MASGQRSPLREKAEWLLRFAGMSLATPRDFRRLRLEAHRWLDPDGARPLEWGELREPKQPLRLVPDRASLFACHLTPNKRGAGLVHARVDAALSRLVGEGCCEVGVP